LEDERRKKKEERRKKKDERRRIGVGIRIKKEGRMEADGRCM
jgi:hypothetical protein